MFCVFDEINKRWFNQNIKECIVHICNDYIEIGYISYEDMGKLVRAMLNGRMTYVLINDNNKQYLYFDRFSGIYRIGEKNELNNYKFGRGGFPYSFEKYYTTRHLENLFEKRASVDESIDFKYIDELPYTFGFEFETANGYVPELEALSSGLIPLRDGSISGIEYSTIVLQGNKGLNFLKKQIEILKEYTIFDVNCSLHIHIGNFQLTPEVLLAVNNLFVGSNICEYVPRFAFQTTYFKRNREKNYCEMNKSYVSFKEMYRDLVGENYFGNLYQNHPKDIKGNQKWHISTRYRAVNFINAICYDHAKTIEFRFLHPSYNFDRILCWLFVLAAFVKYAENKLPSTTKIERIVSNVYSKELSDILIRMLNLQYDVIEAQNSVDDECGMRNDIEDTIMSYKNLNYNNKFFY